MFTRQANLLLKAGIILACLAVLGCGKPGRGQILADLEKVKNSLEIKPDDKGLKVRYAKLLYQAGFFEEAREQLEPVCLDKDASSEALFIMTKLEFLFSRYNEAERLAQVMLDNYGRNKQTFVEANMILFGVYYSHKSI
jgi:tetratricopeptide (TPR) repeat protein